MLAVSKLRHALLVFGLAIGLPMLLAACGSGGTLALNVTAVQQDESQGKQRVFVATLRERTSDDVLFSGERGRRSSFATVDISIPRDHIAGELELPSSGLPTPSKHFTVTQARRLELPKIKAEVIAELSKRPPSDRDVLVFVHGYNTTFADAAFRFAQIVHDSGFKGVPVLFTWPSRGELLAYPYDRESALYSRDFLEAGLRSISRDLGVAKFDVLAHSMGTLLTLEALRQAEIRGDGSFGGKLRDVMLAAPDVDIDVFRTQVRTIKRPITVFVSKDDRALSFSRRIAGDKRRLGALSTEDADSIAELKKYNVEIIDLSDIKTSDSLNHAKFAASPKIVAMIGRRLQADGGIKTAGSKAGDHLVGGVTGVIGSTVEFAVNAPVSLITGGRGPTINLTGP
ncbi:MAG: alpha/beta hydrolase [Bosea sp. (in: a-proteobacteria)]